MSRRLLEKACEIAEYDGTDETKRPKWMRQQPFVPCNCRKCFHCKNNLTGRYGPPVKEHPRKRSRAATPSSTPSHSSSSASRSSGSRVSFPTTAISRGRTYDIMQPHVCYPDRRQPLDNMGSGGKDCWVCKEEGRKRKPDGLVKNKDDKYMNRCKVGCPHLNCRLYPVCKEHWKEFKHR